MKNNIFIIFLLISTTSAFAQIPKGSATLGGNISLLRNKEQITYRQSTTWSEYQSNILSLTPSYGYFIANNFSIGANVSTLFSRSTSPATVSEPKLHSNNRSIGAGPQLLYYLPLDDKLYAYAAAGYTWFWTRYKYEYTPDGIDITTVTSNSRYTTLDAGLGLSYFVNPSTAVEAGFGYTHARYKDQGGNLNNKTNNIALNIGFRIFLRKA